MNENIWRIALLLTGLGHSLGSDLHLFDSITGNQLFYSRNISQYPSKQITIEFQINFLCDPSDPFFPQMKVYTDPNHEDFSKKCIGGPIGQFLNDHLYLPIKPKRYKSTECTGHWGNVTCQGKITIQDFRVRNYSVAFGFQCMFSPLRRNLTRESLTLNLRIFGQTNVTTCKMSDHDYNDPIHEVCLQFYNHSSFPNLMGHQDAHEAYDTFRDGYRLRPAFASLFSCHQHLMEGLCCLFFPRCQPEKEEVIHMCKEMCQDIVFACWNKIKHVASLLFPGRKNHLLHHAAKDANDAAEYCDYLPSWLKNETCFYKPAQCKPPPKLKNANLVNQSQSNHLPVPVNSVFEYICSTESFKLDGNHRIKCLCNGEWSKLPVCQEKVTQTSTFLFPFIAFVFPLILFVSFIFWLQCRKKPIKSGRNKQYDALVICSFDGQHDFVVKTLLPEFEEHQNPPFKFLYHERDFCLGAKILDNIQDAVENSNSAIVLICQRFLDSIWCIEEFERCLLENRKDPEFRLFLVLMQPADTLINLPKTVENHLQNKTYAKVDDVKAFKRIADYLRLLRRSQKRNQANVEELEELEVQEDLLWILMICGCLRLCCVDNNICFLFAKQRVHLANKQSSRPQWRADFACGLHEDHGVLTLARFALWYRLKKLPTWDFRFPLATNVFTLSIVQNFLQKKMCVLQRYQLTDN